MIFFIAAEVSPGVKPKKPPIPQESAPHFSITTKQTIDKSHADVQSLMDLDFSEEQSIMAIQRCGDVSEAMDYLMSGGEEGVFQASSDQREVVQEVRRKPTPRSAGKRLFE